MSEIPIDENNISREMSNTSTEDAIEFYGPRIRYEDLQRKEDPSFLKSTWDVIYDIAMTAKRSSVIAELAYNDYKGLVEAFKPDAEESFNYESLKGTPYENDVELFYNANVRTNAEARVLMSNIESSREYDQRLSTYGLIPYFGVTATGIALAACFDPISKALNTINPYSNGLKHVLFSGAAVEASLQGAKLINKPGYTKEDAATEAAVGMAFGAGMYGAALGSKNVFLWFKGKYTKGDTVINDIAKKFKVKVTGELSDLPAKDSSNFSIFGKSLSKKEYAEMMPPKETTAPPTPKPTQFTGADGKTIELPSVMPSQRSKIAGSNAFTNSIIFDTSPTLRTLRSESNTVRSISRKIFPATETTFGHLEGVADNKFTLIEYAKTKDPYVKKYREIIVKSIGDSKMTRVDFSEALTEALHSGDQHENKYVQACAREIRKSIIDPISKSLVDGNIIELEELAEGSSWGRRVWSTKALTNKKQEFKDMIERNLEKNWMLAQEKATQRTQVLKEMENEFVKYANQKLSVSKEPVNLEEEIGAFFGRYAENYGDWINEILVSNYKTPGTEQFKKLANVSNDIKKFMDKTTKELAEFSYTPGKTAEDIWITLSTERGSAGKYGLGGGKKGTFKERIIDFIPTSDAVPFIDHDAISLTEIWIDNASRELAIYETLGKSLGKRVEVPLSGPRQQGIKQIKIEPLTNFEHLKQGIYNEFVTAGNSVEEAIEKTNNSLADLEAMLAMMRGTHGAGRLDSLTYYSRLARGLIHLTKLGGAGLSAIIDLGAAIKTVGVRTFFEEGIPIFVKNLAGLRNKRLLEDFADILPSHSGRFLDEGLRHGEMYNIANPSVLLQTVRRGNEFLNKINGVQWIDRALFDLNCEIVYVHVTKLLRKNSLNAKDITSLAKLGIDKRYIPKLQEAFSNSIKVDGVWNAVLDQKQKDLISTAMRVGGETLSLNPAVYDMPLFYKNDWAKLLGMYKSFLLTSHRRILFSTAVERDINHLMMVATGAAMGMMKIKIQEMLGGVSEEKRKSGETLIMDGLKEFGTAGLFGMPLDAVGSIVDPDFNGFRPGGVVGQTVPTHVLGDMTVAGGAIIRDTKGWAAGKKTRNWTKAEKRAIKRITPFNNIILGNRIWNDKINNGK